jgi:hypothetical protein
MLFLFVIYLIYCYYTTTISKKIKIQQQSVKDPDQVGGKKWEEEPSSVSGPPTWYDSTFNLNSKL